MNIDTKASDSICTSAHAEKATIRTNSRIYKGYTQGPCLSKYPPSNQNLSRLPMQEPDLCRANPPPALKFTRRYA
ncbi:hypothetical protein ACTXT7_014376 [Hymenolepis weldensis]